MQLAKLAKIALISALAASITTEAFAIDATANLALNVRTGPGTNYAAIDTLYAGEVVNVTGCQSNGWCAITHSGPDGWVSGKYLSEIGSNNSSSSGSSSADAAAAAAIITLFGALAIGAAISMGKNQSPTGPASCHSGTHWVGPVPGGRCVPNFTPHYPQYPHPYP